MPQYLIDLNLPYRFSLWDSDGYIHLKDLGGHWTDEQVWEYAKEKQLTIISKDADFSDKIIISAPPPKVIHIRIGNMKIQEMYEFLHSNWEEILQLNKEFKLINVFRDRIESIQ